LGRTEPQHGSCARSLRPRPDHSTGAGPTASGPSVSPDRGDASIVVPIELALEHRPQTGAVVRPLAACVSERSDRWPDSSLATTTRGFEKPAAGQADSGRLPPPCGRERVPLEPPRRCSSSVARACSTRMPDARLLVPSRRVLLGRKWARICVGRDLHRAPHHGEESASHHLNRKRRERRRLRASCQRHSTSCCLEIARCLEIAHTAEGTMSAP
jgi:hypothetical protein